MRRDDVFGLARQARRAGGERSVLSRADLAIA